MSTNVTPQDAKRWRMLWLMVVVGAAMILGVNLGKPPLVEFDEFYTAERSREMLITGFPAKVQDNFAINVLKPPLHYYLTGATLAAVSDRETALRIWPMLFGLGSIAFAGLLAKRIAGGWTVAAPLASLILAASFLFWSQSRSALLDTGTAFFTLMTVFSLLTIRQNPRWWIAAGVAAALSGLQKYPLGLLPMVVFLGIELFDARSLKPLKSISVWLGFGIVAASYAGWFLLQALNSSGTFVLRAFKGQFLNRATESEAGDYVNSFVDYFQLLLADYLALAFVMLVALVAVLAIKSLRKQRALLGMVITAILFLIAIGLMSKYSERYLVAIYPLLACATAVVIAQIPRRGMSLSIIGLMLLLVLGSWPFKLQDWNNRPSPQAAAVRLAPSFAASIQPDEQVLLTVSEDTWPELHMGSVMFYGDIPERLWFLDLGNVAELKQYFSPNVRGIGHVKDVEILREALPGFEIIAQDEHVIHYTAKSPRQAIEPEALNP